MKMVHNHHHHHHGGGKQNIPRGHVAVTVGPEHQKFVIPVAYVNHSLFSNLLKEAEEEYGFAYEEGPIIIPCDVAEFCQVTDLIEKETTSDHHHHHNHHHHRHHRGDSLDNHHHRQFLCFKA